MGQDNPRHHCIEKLQNNKQGVNPAKLQVLLICRFVRYRPTFEILILLFSFLFHNLRPPKFIAMGCFCRQY